MTIKGRRHIAIIMLLALMLVFAFSVSVFADGTAQAGTGETAVATGDAPVEAIEKGIGQVSQKAYNIIKVATISIATLFFAYNAFKAILGGEKGMENAKRNMYYIIVAVIIVFLAPMAISEIYEMLHNMTESQASQVFSGTLGNDG